MPSRNERLLLAALILGGLFAVWLNSQPSVQRYGYSPDPEGAKVFASSLPKPTFAAAAPDVMRQATPRDVFLWRAMDSAHRAR